MIAAVFFRIGPAGRERPLDLDPRAPGLGRLRQGLPALPSRLFRDIGLPAARGGGAGPDPFWDAPAHWRRTSD